MREALGQDIPCSLMIQIHEKGGVHKNKKALPGLKRSEVEEILPEIMIDGD